MHEPQIRVEWIGNERNAVVILDDLAPDPLALRNIARELSFVPMPDQYYPGTRAIAPESYVATIGETIRDALREFYGCGAVRVERCYYSLSTTLLEELTVEQRLPHFDTVFENYYAVVHFLCPPELGGTAFFRHRSTGFETISPARQAEFTAKLKSELVEYGPPPPAYVGGDTEFFDHLETIDACQTRALIFRGNTFHSGAVSNSLPLSDDPLSGRLTVVTFLIAE